MAKYRRTKKQYAELFDNPSALFNGAQVILWPNGQPEIWIRSADGNRAIKITARDGNAGLGLTISRFACSEPLTATGNLHHDSAVANQQDFEEITVCQYRTDEQSQAFKRWYADRESNPYPYETAKQ